MAYMEGHYGKGIEMTYNTNTKVLFIHIPKTAGTSIKKILSLNGFVHDAVHADYKMAKEKIENYNEYFKFSSVRNPFSRMVSWYNHLKHLSFAGEDRRGRVVLDPGTFENFIFNHNQIYAGHPMRGYTFRKQQVDFIGNDMNFIIRFENLQKDFNTVCEYIGIEPMVLPVRRKTKTVNYRDYYNAAIKDAVYRIFRKDFKTFKYEF